MSRFNWIVVVFLMLKTRQCSNVKCSNVKHVKENYCPECGAEVLEYGLKDGTRLIRDKRNIIRKLRNQVRVVFLSVINVEDTMN